MLMQCRFRPPLEAELSAELVPQPESGDSNIVPKQHQLAGAANLAEDNDVPAQTEDYNEQQQAQQAGSACKQS